MTHDELVVVRVLLALAIGCVTVALLVMLQALLHGKDFPDFCGQWVMGGAALFVAGLLFRLAVKYGVTV